MSELIGKLILIVIPRNQFHEGELSALRAGLEGARLHIVSKTGQEATGMDRSRFTPDGRIVDWNHIPGFPGKYDAVVVLGGKGAPKSLWNDDILPQILTDHYRADKVVAGVGLGVAVLARAGLLCGEVAGPEDPSFRRELEDAGISWTDAPLIEAGKVITIRDDTAIPKFVNVLARQFQTG